MIGKIKTTRKQLTKAFSRIFYCGYCDLQNIFYLKSPSFYNSGLYGWNYDCYDCGNIAITTGYRGMFGKRIPLELIEKFDKKALKVLDKMFGESYDKKRAELEKIQDEFLKALKAL